MAVSILNLFQLPRGSRGRTEVGLLGPPAAGVAVCGPGAVGQPGRRRGAETSAADPGEKGAGPAAVPPAAQPDSEGHATLNPVVVAGPLTSSVFVMWSCGWVLAAPKGVFFFFKFNPPIGGMSWKRRRDCRKYEETFSRDIPRMLEKGIKQDLSCNDHSMGFSSDVHQILGAFSPFSSPAPLKTAVLTS